MYYFLLGWFQNVFGLILGFGKFSSYLAESFEGMKFRMKKLPVFPLSQGTVYVAKSHRCRLPCLLFAPMRFL